MQKNKILRQSESLLLGPVGDNIYHGRSETHIHIMDTQITVLFRGNTMNTNTNILFIVSFKPSLTPSVLSS